MIKEQDDLDDLDEGIDATAGDEDEGDDAGETRADRRKRRGKILEENAQLRAELANLSRSQAEMAGYLRARSEGQQQVSAQDHALGDLDNRITGTYELEDNLRRKVRELEANYGARKMAIPEDELKKIEAQGRALERTRGELMAEKVVIRRGLRPQDSSDTARAMLEQEHGDVMGNQKAVQWANLEYQKRVVEGSKAGKPLVDQVMKDARERFRLTSDHREDSRYTGPSGRAGEGAGGSAESRGVMTSEDREMAHAFYSSLPPKEAERLYRKKFLNKSA